MKTKKCIILIIIITLLSISFTVNAAENDSYKIGLEPSKTTLNPGDTVTISLKISNINIQSGEKGIGSYEGTIVYDENVFEGLKMKGNDSWDNPTENEGRFASVKSDGICTNESQEIAQITFTVKDNATIGNTKIQIKDFEGSNGVENIPTQDIELSVKIEKSDDGETNIVDDNTASGDNNGTIVGGNSGNTSTGTTNSGNKGTTTTPTNVASKSASQSSLPYTGSGNIIIFIAICIVIAIFSYIKYKRTY